MNLSENEIIEKYESGLSISYLSRTYDIPYKRINRLLESRGIAIRMGRKRKQFSEEQRDIMKKLFLDERKSCSYIAKQLDSSEETIRRELKNLGVYESDYLKYRVNYNLKHDYFSTIDNSHKAYWLGLLFTDGSVSLREYRIRISLQQSDKEILEKLRNELNVYSDLIYDKRGNGGFSLEFSSKTMFEDLSKYGIVPKKTYTTFNLPIDQIPKEFVPDFLRGMIDGDGQVTFYQGKSIHATVDFCQYYESIVLDFQNAVDLLINKSNHSKTYKTSCWHCHWRGRQQCIKILDALYGNSDLYIQRKYDRYMFIKYG